MRRYRAAVLFDVDGTLIDSRGAGRRALGAAVCDLFAAPRAEVEKALGGIDFRGATDRAIIARLGTRLELPLADRLPELLAAYERRLAGEVERAGGRLLPGVAGLVAALEERAELLVGLLTGNFRSTARIKLGPFGLARMADRPGGFGDDGWCREEIARIAAARAASRGVARERIVVVGDTEHDVAAARAAGALPVAVASGWTDRADLAEARAELLLGDLSDPQPLLSLVRKVLGET